MYSKKTKVINKTGLHARPASEFTSAASKFKSKITIKKAGDASEVNAKSIVMLLSMAIAKDTEIELIANGEDEREAVDKLVALIETGFGEV